jgi:hypothetical protein
MAKHLWGERSNQYKYLERQSVDDRYHQASRISRVSRFEEGLKWRNEEKAKIEKEKLKKEKAEKMLEEKKTELRECLKIALRYDLDETYGVGELLEELEDRCKYLSLGLAMLRCRNDWNDGCSVDYALSRFKVETEQDQEIYDDVSEAIDNFNEDRDGRYFRDTKWDYTEIFALADKQLFTDVMWLFEKDEW